jgi:ferredoxin-NADP reductase
MSGASSRLIGSEKVAERTMAFHFARPPGFTFKAGQAIDLLLGGAAVASDANRHTFSIASAPSEDRLTVATRMRDSAFKRALGALQPGSVVGLEGPSGSLTLHGDASRAAVLIAGGIGITPFMSMLRQASRDRPARRLLLLYANRRAEEAAWLQELKTLERDWPGFRLRPVMTAGGPGRRIDDKTLKSAAEGLPQPMWYVVGAPGMVAAMRAALDACGVADDDIRSEDFHGY